jgi:hypothetical protein
MGSGLSELGEEGNLCVPVGGEGKDWDDPNLDGGEITVNKFRFVGELENDPIIRSQAQIDQMEGEPIYLFSHLRVGHVVSHVGKRDSMRVPIHPFIKFFPECLVYPVAFFLEFLYKGFWKSHKTFQHDLTFHSSRGSSCSMISFASFLMQP